MQQSEKETEAQKLENLSIQVQAMNENFDRLFKALEQHGLPVMSKQISIESSDSQSDEFTSAPLTNNESNGNSVPSKNDAVSQYARKKSQGNVDFLEAQLANPTKSRKSIMRTYTTTIEEEDETTSEAEDGANKAFKRRSSSAI